MTVIRMQSLSGHQICRKNKVSSMNPQEGKLQSLLLLSHIFIPLGLKRRYKGWVYIVIIIPPLCITACSFIICLEPFRLLIFWNAFGGVSVSPLISFAFLYPQQLHVKDFKASYS